MLVVKCNQPCFFDVDSTLIKWRPSEDDREENGTECDWILRTMDLGADGKLVMKEKIETDAFIPLRGNIEQLKEHKRRGHTVFVWSLGGAEWAAQAIKMLGLEDYVDLVVEKPKFVYDDKPVQEWMPTPEFIKEEIVEETPVLAKKSRVAENPFATEAREEMPRFGSTARG
jgi:hypothetical protein